MVLLLETQITVVIEDDIPYKLLAKGDINGWEVSIYVNSKNKKCFFSIDTVEFGFHKFYKLLTPKQTFPSIVEEIEEGTRRFQMQKAEEQFHCFKEVQKARGLYAGVS